MTATLQDLSREIWDVVVVGAGPAGCSVSLALAKSGLNVLLVDRSLFPRHKVCGGCLNADSIHALDQLGLGNLADKHGGRSYRTLVLGTQGRHASIGLQDGMSISRTTFDAALVDECKRNGVTVGHGISATLESVRDNRHWISLRTTTETASVSSRIAILAHGLKGGRISPRSRIGAGVLLDVTPDSFPDHAISMAVGAGGYVGAIQVERGRFNLAAAFDSRFVRESGTLGRAAQRILKEAGFPKVPGIESAPWKGTPSLTRRSARVAGKRWFAVGDAAGYVEPFTGEGMAWAMTGALALAPIAERAAREWDDSYVREWTKQHSRIIVKRQLQCRILSKVLRSQFLTQSLVRILRLCPALAVPFIGKPNRLRGELV